MSASSLSPALWELPAGSGKCLALFSHSFDSIEPHSFTTRCSSLAQLMGILRDKPAFQISLSGPMLYCLYCLLLIWHSWQFRFSQWPHYKQHRYDSKYDFPCQANFSFYAPTQVAIGMLSLILGIWELSSSNVSVVIVNFALYICLYYISWFLL